MFGVKLKEDQVVSLCQNKNTKISGIKKKNGSGTFTATAIPKGITDYEYEKDGVVYKGRKLESELKIK